MTWVKIDEAFTESPEAARAGALGIAMHLAGLCYSNRHLTDGKIPTSIARRLIDLDEIAADSAGKYMPDADEIFARLVAGGLWEPVDGGFQIVDFFNTQPSREKVEEQRAERARAGKAGAEARWAKQRASDLDSKPDGKVLSGSHRDRKRSASQTDGNSNGKVDGKVHSKAMRS
jgi:hypothetical protein